MVESAQIAIGGSLNHPPTVVDLIYLSQVVHERHLKLSARQNAGGSNLSVMSGTRVAAWRKS